VFYLPNGVDPEFFRRWHPHPPRVTFGHVGKPNPRKGGDLIIEAAHKAQVELRTVVRTSKLAMAPEKIAAWYQGITVMVTASNMDGTPNPMLEGAATECALLSTRIGNMPELIKSGYNGWLLDETLPYHGPGPVCQQPEDYVQVDRLRDELVARMRWCADHPLETVTMGKAARDSVVADWTWARQVQHVAAMWEQLLG
jgi:glycosyltransferase involved in cell wall biosynthesis